MRRLLFSIALASLCVLSVSCKKGNVSQDAREPHAHQDAPESVPLETSVQVRYHLMPIHRLSPGAFPGLPQPIVQALETWGCTIPQTWLYGEQQGFWSGVPHNAVRGAFRSRGALDWAVLCSRSDTSAIVVFWGGDPSDTSLIGRAADYDWTQNVDGRGSMGFSRAITVASPEEIREKNPDVPSSLRDREVHDGIEEHFVEKASTILYFDKGVRLVLFGSD